MNERTPEEPFDVEQVYDEKIFPLMKEIIAICKEHKIPMLASFQYDPESFCTTFLEYPDRKAHARLQTGRNFIYEGFIAYHTTVKPIQGGDAR